MTGEDQRRLTVLCAWCGVVLQQGDGPSNAAISHGICDKCVPTVIAEIEERLRQGQNPQRDASESGDDEGGL